MPGKSDTAIRDPLVDSHLCDLFQIQQICLSQTMVLQEPYINEAG